jgi:hypothetical protein
MAERSTPATGSPGSQCSPTLSVAAADVTLPHPLDTTQSYDPASVAAADAIAYVADVAPAIVTPSLRHWKAGEPVPPAVTLKVADVPAHTENNEGCVVIDGGRFTVSVATDDVTLPHGLVTTQSYEPASPDWAHGIVYVADVAPEMLAPPLRHWYVSGAVPPAVTLNVAEPRSHAATLEGCAAIDTTAPLTVSVAAELVTLPQALLTTQSYEPASVAATDAIVYVADVAPEMFTPFLRQRNEGDVPDADTANEADAPAHRVSDEGCPVIDGAAFTVTVADVVTAFPHAFVKTHVYVPASEAAIDVIVSVVDDPAVGEASAPDAPLTVPPPADAPPAPLEMVTPLRRHRNVTFERPLIGEAVSVSVCPGHSVRDAGWSATFGPPLAEYRAVNADANPPAVANDPPAITSLPDTPSTALTPAFSPVPSADHDAPFHRAIRFVATPPAVVKSPPAIRSPFESDASPRTVLLVPEPSADHDAPFHRAIRFAATPPAVVKPPPAIRPPLVTATALTAPFMPEPIPDHLTPSHTAMLFAATSPAAVNAPATTRSPFDRSATALTVPLTPEPIGDHDAPFQIAMLLAGKPPAVVNVPPATTPVLVSASRALTVPFNPAPSADHDVPFHRATRLAATPLAEVNAPPAKRLPLEKEATALTVPFMPVPSVDQPVPSHLATRLAAAPPAVVNAPPATTMPSGSSVKAFTVLLSPGTPSPGSHCPPHAWAWAAGEAHATSSAIRAPSDRTNHAAVRPSTPATSPCAMMNLDESALPRRPRKTGRRNPLPTPRARSTDRQAW